MSSQPQYTVYSGITILAILRCVSVQWDCFGDAVASFIGYNKLARETGSKCVPQNNTIGKYNSIKKNSHETRKLPRESKGNGKTVC